MRVSTRPALERLQAIDSAVSRLAWPNARTLARELEVTHRTIQRDIAFMHGSVPRWNLTESGTDITTPIRPTGLAIFQRPRGSWSRFWLPPR